MLRVSWRMGGRLHAVLSSVDSNSARFIRTSLHRSFAVYRQRNPLIPLCLAGKEGIALHVGVRICCGLHFGVCWQIIFGRTKSGLDK